MRVHPAVAFLFLSMMLSQASAQEDKAGDPHKALEYFVGTWDAEVKFQLPDGKEGSGKAVCRTKAVLEGKFLHQEYQSKFMGQPLTIWQLLGYDSVKKKFVEFHLNVNPMQTHTMITEGMLSKDGKVLTLAGDTLDAASVSPDLSRARLLSLVVPDLAGHIPGVHDGHDHSVAGAVPGQLCLARRAAGGVEDDLAQASSHRVHRDHIGSRLLVGLVELLHHKELHPRHQGLLTTGDQGSCDPA